MSRPRTTNILLSALSDEDYMRLHPHFDRITLPRERVFVTAHEPITRVYFPEDGVASIVIRTVHHGTTEIGIFGRDGMSGAAILLGADRSPHDSFIQVPGTSALGIDADRLLAAVDASPTLRAVLLRFIRTAHLQTAQIAMSTRTSGSRRGSRAGCSCATTAPMATRSRSPTSSWR